ncbi:MAG: heavy metal sensor histidine kinase [Candidatus Didemnitutus sp.]|nr:heavy metal sensor histidine kinase [Candidatus Didemnitutus sp.]
MSRPPARHPWSMTARLIALQMLVVALLVGGASLALYNTVRRHLDVDTRSQLENQRVVLSRWLTDALARGPLGANDRTHLAPLLASLSDLHVRVLDRAGRPMIDTAADSHVSLPDFPAAGQPLAEARNAEGTRFVLSTSLIAGSAPDGPTVLQIASNDDDDDALLAHIRQRMLLVFVLMVAASGLLAALVARGIFRPVARLTRTVAEVQPSRLHTRIATNGWPAELTALARELDDMLVRLDDSFRRLARFSADLSHELRTPINNLRGEAEVALRLPRSDSEYRRVLESSLEECGRLARLIDTLLFVARADHPAHTLVLRPLDAAEICRSVAEFFEPLASERSVTLLVRGAGRVQGDSELLRRAVANLVDNAVKHAPDGGHVDLTVRAGPDGTTEIEVRDDGGGILETELPHVFDRFYRGRTHAPSQRGFGLGLPIVRSIMELHRGTATIASVPQAGTTATLRFPLPPPAT